MKLGVNVDHVATLRQARGETWPSPLWAATTAEAAGADQITVHLREDRRHIQDHDVFEIKSAISIPLNLEMAATQEMLSIALKLAPHTVTVVPEKRNEVTTEGGLNLLPENEELKSIVSQLLNQGIEVSAFVDPDQQQIVRAIEFGFPTIELHTGEFARKYAYELEYERELSVLSSAAMFASAKGLRVAAGHGLTLGSVPIIGAITQIDELNIGHALVSDSLTDGLAAATTRYARACQAR